MTKINNEQIIKQLIKKHYFTVTCTQYLPKHVTAVLNVTYGIIDDGRFKDNVDILLDKNELHNLTDLEHKLQNEYEYDDSLFTFDETNGVKCVNVHSIELDKNNYSEDDDWPVLPNY